MSSSEEDDQSREGDDSDAAPYTSGRNGSIEGANERPDGDDSGGGDVGDTPWYREIDYGRQVVFPILTIVFLVVILLAFKKILLPFVFACALVYLMEPVVVRLSRSPEDPRGLPRWITVILVYLVFFSVWLVCLEVLSIYLSGVFVCLVCLYIWSVFFSCLSWSSVFLSVCSFCLSSLFGLSVCISVCQSCLFVRLVCLSCLYVCLFYLVCLLSVWSHCQSVMSVYMSV